MTALRLFYRARMFSTLALLAPLVLLPRTAAAKNSCTINFDNQAYLGSLPDKGLNQHVDNYIYDLGTANAATRCWSSTEGGKLLDTYVAGHLFGGTGVSFDLNYQLPLIACPLDDDGNTGQLDKNDFCVPIPSPETKKRVFGADSIFVVYLRGSCPEGDDDSVCKFNLVSVVAPEKLTPVQYSTNKNGTDSNTPGWSKWKTLKTGGNTLNVNGIFAVRFRAKDNDEGRYLIDDVKLTR